MLWRIQYFKPYFARSMPEDGKVLTFARDISLGNLLTMVEVPSIWIQIDYRELPSIEFPVRALAVIPPGEARVPPQTPTEEMISVPLVYITPLDLVQSLLTPLSSHRPKFGLFSP